MNKDDILALSRKEKNDEGFLFLMSKGGIYGTKIFCFVIIFVLIIATIKWNTTDMALILAILWAYLTGYFLGISKARKDKKIGLVLFSSFLTIYMLATYVYVMLF